MIEVERRLLAVLRQSAILGPITGPQEDGVAEGGRDVAHGPTRSACKRNSERRSAKSTNPSASSRSDGVSGWPAS